MLNHPLIAKPCSYALAYTSVPTSDKWKPIVTETSDLFDDKVLSSSVMSKFSFYLLLVPDKCLVSAAEYVFPQKFEIYGVRCILIAENKVMSPFEDRKLVHGNQATKAIEDPYRFTLY